MFLLITDNNKAEYTEVLDQMHKLRHEVFVEYLKWEHLTSRDGREYDQYDVPEARYIVMLEDGQVVASVRLNSFDAPTLLTDVFSKIVEFEKLPHGAESVDLTRFVVSPHIGDPTRMERYGAEIICAILEYGVAQGLREYTAVISPHFLATVLQWGVDAYAMGFPVGEGRAAHIAVRVPVHQGQISTLYHYTKDYTPRLAEPPFTRWHRETFGAKSPLTSRPGQVSNAAE